MRLKDKIAIITGGSRGIGFGFDVGPIRSRTGNVSLSFMIDPGDPHSFRGSCRFPELVYSRSGECISPTLGLDESGEFVLLKVEIHQYPPLRVPELNGLY